jgi:uncharacterized membrane protein YkvA (DUF1232 family)
MRISFELEATDIARFHAALERAERLAATMDECDIVDTAKEALNALPIGGAPGYVRKRLVGVQRLILMLEDGEWALPSDERNQVLRTLVYFADPEDMIPDEVEVIGLLDDAIMLELLVRHMKHVVDAYDDFCEFRNGLRAVAGDRIDDARTLARRRDSLRERMRRRATQAGSRSVRP